MHAERQSIRALPEKLGYLFVGTPIVPRNECDRTRKAGSVHGGNEVSIVQVPVRALQWRIIDDEIGEAVFALPASALEHRPQKHGRRKKLRKVLSNIDLATHLLLDVGNGAAGQQKRLAAVSRYQNQKWREYDGYPTNHTAEIRRAYKAEIRGIVHVAE